MTERKPVFCECPKVGNFMLNDALEHDVCGKRVVKNVPVRKPVFCSHPNIENQKRVQQVVTCYVCNERWDTSRYGSHPKVAIGYVEEEK